MCLRSKKDDNNNNGNIDKNNNRNKIYMNNKLRLQNKPQQPSPSKQLAINQKLDEPFPRVMRLS